MYRWRKPPTLPRAYISAAFSSKRRMSAIWVSSRRASSPSSRVWGGAVFVCAIGLSLELSFCLCYRVLLPSQGAPLVDREAPALAEDRHVDREAHRDLGGGHAHHEEYQSLSLGRPVALAEGDQGQVRRVEHQLDRHEDHQRVSA